MNLERCKLIVEQCYYESREDVKDLPILYKASGARLVHRPLPDP